MWTLLGSFLLTKTKEWVKLCHKLKLTDKWKRPYADAHNYDLMINFFKRVYKLYKTYRHSCHFDRETTVSNNIKYLFSSNSCCAGFNETTLIFSLIIFCLIMN